MKSLFFFLAIGLTFPQSRAATYLAEGPVPQFTLESELRFLNVTSEPLTYAGLKDKEIAITVDDGPDPKTTPVILKIFREHGVKATFFLIGNRAKAYPEMVKMILEEGHSVGNHTWDHALLSKMPIEKVKEEITSTQKVLETISAEVQIPLQPFFRFPTGAGASKPKLKALLKDLHLANFYWSMSAHDSRTQDPNVALNTSIEMIDKYKKGIFLLHEIHPAGLKMLPYFLSELHNRGYKTIYFKAKEHYINVNSQLR